MVGTAVLPPICSHKTPVRDLKKAGHFDRLFLKMKRPKNVPLLHELDEAWMIVMISSSIFLVCLRGLENA